MATKMNDFLLQYYMQRRFNDMPPEVRARYDDYLKGEDGKGGRGDFRGNMKDWRDKLMHQNADGAWINNALPDPTVDLDDDEWKKLYKAFRDALRSMDGDRDSFKDNADATNFLNDYFGDASSHIFSKAVADPAVEPFIEDLGQVLKDNPDLEYLLSGYLGDMSYSDFVTGVGEKKYNKDINFQRTLKNVVGYLRYMQEQQARGFGSEEFAQFKDAFINIKLKDIKDGLDDKVRTDQLDRFKDNYKELLNAVTRKKINDVFKNHDGRKITGKIEEAKSKVDYDNANSDDFVPAKRDDELTPLQQMRRDVGDTYDAVLGKYLSRHGNRVYFSDHARKIVEAIDKAKIKPTDGLDKVLASAADIKKTVKTKSPKAADDFDWFIKTMQDIKETMPKAFAGALKHGGQMRAIISEIIMKAIRENKVPEAKTAMEVLSVIKYGYTTSKIMDAMRQTEFKVFSDGSLSWNKNDGMKFVTKALDQSIKAAFIGIGYGVTMVGNAYRLNGSKFNGKRGKRMQNSQEKWAAQNQSAKDAASRLRDTNNLADNRTLAAKNAELANLNTGPNPINAGNVDGLRTQVANERATNAAEKDAIEQAKKQTPYTDAQNLVGKIDNLDNRMTNLEPEINQLYQDENQLFADINTLKAQMNDPATYAGMPPAAASAHANALSAEIQAKQSELRAKKTERQQKIQEMSNAMNAYQTATGQTWHNGLAGAHGAAYAGAQTTLNDMATREQNLENATNATDDLSNRVAQYDEAKERVTELTTAIAKRNEQIDQWDDKHKDQYKELMAYWDMLETGRDSHTGKMYKWDLFRANKDSQKGFDAQKAAIIQNFNNGYSYAA